MFAGTCALPHSGCACGAGTHVCMYATTHVHVQAPVVMSCVRVVCVCACTPSCVRGKVFVSGGVWVVVVYYTACFAGICVLCIEWLRVHELTRGAGRAACGGAAAAGPLFVSCIWSGCLHLEW